jgi:hypothetical protein
MSSTRTARFLAAPVVAVAGFAALSGIASAAPTSVQDVLDNPSCADLAPAGTTWTEAKIDKDPSAGSQAVGAITVTITKAADGTLGWDTTADGTDIDAVIMKGGPDARVYFYDGTADTSDSGLHAPDNANGGGAKYYGISHVSFCYGPPAPAPQATSTPTVTKTEAAPQAEVAAAAVAADPVETQVLGVSIEAPAVAPAAAPAQLAATGLSTTRLLTLIGMALVLLGGLGLALVGRPQAAR